MSFRIEENRLIIPGSQINNKKQQRKNRWIKMASQRAVFILILATLVILLAAPESFARPEYLTNLTAVYGAGSCNTCHLNDASDGLRNSYGTLFESQPNHANATGSALKAIGIPPLTIPVATYAVITAPAATNYSNQVHSNHVGPGTAGFDCATCHGSPPTYNNLRLMCIKCHPVPTATAIPPPVSTYIPPPVSTYIPPPAPTATAIVVSTVSKVTPLSEQAVYLKVDKKAHLNVTYDIGKGRTDGEVLVSVRLNNTGNATATNVLLTINHPAGIKVTSVSGSDQKGNIITWSGDIIPGDSHLTRYYARGVNTNLASIEVPLRVEYEKTSPAEKAKALAPYAASAPQAYAAAISDRDMEIINLTIRLALVVIPGFEGIIAIFAMMVIGVLGKKRHRGG